MSVPYIRHASEGGLAANHTRRHRSVLAKLEKRLLVAIATRLPPSVSSDALSALGFACMFLAAAGFAAFRLSPTAGLVVVAALAGNWFGDSLDGTVARVRRQQRPRYGFYVDHVMDVAGTSVLVGGIAASGLMDPCLALLLLVAFLLVSAETYLAMIADGVFRISFLGVGPTELRIVLAAGVIQAMSSPWVTVGVLGRHRLFDVGGTIAIVGLVATFVWSAARQTRALYIAEPLPAAAAPEVR